MKIYLLFATLLASATASAPAFAERPPQFVVLAFDGSKSLDMWAATQDFAKEETKAGRPVKFTYFVNAVYYLSDSFKKSYDAPGAGQGKSAIGFGGSAENIQNRFEQTNLAYEGGHEIANHAVGHFDGSKWSEAQWKNEFTQFYDLFFNLFSINKLTNRSRNFPQGWSFDSREIVGFRAPQLGRSVGLYQALPQFGIQYDTSNTAKPNAWPKKLEKLWYFPLASINIAGTAKKTLSMDYNFYYAQSGAKPDAANSAVYEEQMYQSYVNYFQSNYRGNRAPLNIGHHFSLWNGGAYWRAMKRFASNVCGLPEVKCVTYKELLAYVETLSPSQLKAFESGNFAPAAFTASLESTFRPFTAPKLSIQLDPAKLMISDPPEAHDE